MFQNFAYRELNFLNFLSEEVAESKHGNPGDTELCCTPYLQRDFNSALRALCHGRALTRTPAPPSPTIADALEMSTKDSWTKSNVSLAVAKRRGRSRTANRRKLSLAYVQVLSLHTRC